MSKLIVEMEMPLSCVECPIGDYFHKPCPLRDDDCRSYDQFQAYRMNERPSWCPIKGVLPDEHGDLIDRDEVKKEIMKRMPRGCMSGSSDGEAIVCTRRMMLYPISHAKVVIAAERKDDEQIH